MIPYRDDNPTSITPYVTYWLIGSNVAIYLLTLPFHQQATWNLGFIPWEMVNGGNLPDSPWLGAWPSLFTSMFMHGGLLHIGGNMLFLWVFGNNIEEAMGRGRFVFFYLATGLFAHAAQLGHTWWTAHPAPAEAVSASNLMAAMQQGLRDPRVSWYIPTIGASGAISGVLAAYFMLYRSARVYMLIPIGFFLTTIVVPAGFAIGYWFLLQLLSGLFSGGVGGGVAWWAHVGGFAGGLLLYRPLLKPGLKRHDEIRRMWKQVQKQWDE